MNSREARAVLNSPHEIIGRFSPKTIRAPSDRAFYVSLVALALVSCLVQASGLPTSLWRDEAATASASGRSLPQLLRLLEHNDIGMAPYYLVMHYWSTLFGSSEIALRLPSLISGFAIPILTGLLASRMGGRLAGYFAAGLIAMHPLLLPYFAIEARPYALTSALVVGAALVAYAVSCSAGLKLKLLWLWSMLATVAIGMHFLASVAIAAQFFWLTKRPRRPSMLVPVLGIPVAAAGIMALLSYRQAALQSWIPELSVGWVVYSFGTGVLTKGGLIVFASCLAAIVIVLVARASIRVPESLRAVDLLVLTTWSFGPLLAFCLYSLVASPLVLDRYLLFSSTGFASLVGCLAVVAWASIRGISSYRTSLRRAAIVLIVIGLSLSILQNWRSGAFRAAPKPEDLRAASSWITSRELAHDGVLYSPTWAEAGMRWYLSESASKEDVLINLTAENGASAIHAGSLWTPSSQRKISLDSDFPSVGRVFIVGYPQNDNWTPVEDVGSDIALAVRRCWTPIEKANFGIDVELWVRSNGSCSV
jgi:mannosyltransferase